MNKRIGRVIVIAMTSVALVAAQDRAEAEEATPDNGEANPMIEAMGAIGAIIAGADKTAGEAAASIPASAQAVAESEESAGKTANGEPVATKKTRSAKNSVILITSGAAAGAALGTTLGRGSKAAMIGAALGGAAGLIYDRMTYKNPGKI